MPSSPAEHRSPAWTPDVLVDPHRRADKAQRVEAMFDAIAPTYEKVNRLATFGRDAAWRRVAVASAAPKPGEVVLDVCCGTGDMLREFARQQPGLRSLIGLDFSAQMLASGTYDGTSPKPTLIRGDGLRLPLRDASVDVVSCAFGVRNFQRLSDGIRELVRVLRPGGRLAILEFANPSNPLLRAAFRTYCEVVLPRLGAWIARDRSGAYQYLPKSIESFETRESMTRIIREAGCSTCRTQSMNLGGVVLYAAAK